MSSPPRGRPDFDADADRPPVDWRSVGLRRTPQRQVVLDLVRSCYDHPTAEWIHQQARLRIPDISLATVYRTLRLLKEKDLIHEFSGGASPSRFDGTLEEHEHIRCVRCGTVADVDLPEVASIRTFVAQKTGFRVGRYPLLFHGLCEACSSPRLVPEVPGNAEDPRASTEPAGRERTRTESDSDREDGDADRHLTEGYW